MQVRKKNALQKLGHTKTAKTLFILDSLIFYGGSFKRILTVNQLSNFTFADTILYSILD